MADVETTPASPMEAVGELIADPPTEQKSEEKSDLPSQPQASNAAVARTIAARWPHSVQQDATLSVLISRAEQCCKVAAMMQHYLTELHQAQQAYHSSLAKVPPTFSKHELSDDAGGALGRAILSMAELTRTAAHSQQQYMHGLGAKVLPQVVELRGWLDGEARTLRTEILKLSQWLRKNRVEVLDAMQTFERTYALAEESGEATMDPWVVELRLRDMLQHLETEERAAGTKVAQLHARLEQMDTRTIATIKDAMAHVILLQRTMTDKLTQQADNVWDIVHPIDPAAEVAAFGRRTGLHDMSPWSTQIPAAENVPYDHRGAPLTTVIKVGLLRRPMLFKKGFKDHIAVLTACGQLHLFNVKAEPAVRRPKPSVQLPSWIANARSRSSTLTTSTAPNGSGAQPSQGASTPPSPTSTPSLSPSVSLENAAAPPSVPPTRSATELLDLIEDDAPVHSISIQGGAVQMAPDAISSGSLQFDVITMNRQKPLLDRRARHPFRALSEVELHEWLSCIQVRAGVTIGGGAAAQDDATDDDRPPAAVRRQPPPPPPSAARRTTSEGVVSATLGAAAMRSPVSDGALIVAEMDDDGSAAGPPLPPRRAPPPPRTTIDGVELQSPADSRRGSADSQSQPPTPDLPPRRPARRPPPPVPVVPDRADPSVVRQTFVGSDVVGGGSLLSFVLDETSAARAFTAGGVAPAPPPAMDDLQGDLPKERALPARPLRVGSARLDDMDLFIFRDDRGGDEDRDE